MNDHSTGLDVSPGWTKTQATEPADHKLEKTCKQFDVFLPELYLDSARVTNRDPVKKDNTKYYLSCHRNVLKSFTSIIRQMSFPRPRRVGHIYNGKLPLLDYVKKHFQNPETMEKPPHLEDAMQEIQDYTS